MTMRTPSEFSALLAAPCRHQLDAAEGRFIVPTCQIRARDCDRCVEELIATVQREATHSDSAWHQLDNTYQELVIGGMRDLAKGANEQGYGGAGEAFSIAADFLAVVVKVTP